MLRIVYRDIFPRLHENCEGDVEADPRLSEGTNQEKHTRVLFDLEKQTVEAQDEDTP